MSKFLDKSWIVLTATLSSPFVLLALAHLASRQAGWDLSLVLLLLCVLSIYVSFIAGVIAVGCGFIFWLLGVINLKRSRLLLLILLACANIVVSVLWMRMFVRHIHLRY